MSNDHIEVRLGGSQVRGFVSEQGLANFLGIPFATVPDRFRPARSLEYAENAADAPAAASTIDATKYGPRCSQADDEFGGAKEIFFQGLHAASTEPDSDRDCLRLNVYTPPEAVGAGDDARLPVIVWIHGGGFVTGDGNRGHDGNFLVKHAATLQKPFVFVALNYRLGHFGFLHSRELEEEAESHGDIRFANQGLYDQRLGLEWVQRYIHLFGGDPHRVTLAGESAGAVSVVAHILSKSPLCQQAIVMSCPGWSLQTRGEAQAIFDSLVASTGLDMSSTLSSATKLAAVRALTDQQIIEHLGAPALSLTFDDKWFTSTEGPLPQPELVQLDEICRRQPASVERLMIGWCKDDIALWAIPWMHWSADEIQTMVKKVIPDPEFAEAIITEYNIVTPAQTALRGLIEFGTDSLFSGVPQALLCTHPKSSAAYRFDQVDDAVWSPLKGFSFHGLDIGYFMRYPFVSGKNASLSSQATADRFTEAVANFTYGDMPWELFEKSSRMMLLDGKSSLAKAELCSRWEGLASTKEHREMFLNAGHLLVKYRPELAVGRETMQ